MELLKVLFADDEANIRNGLKYILDWEECGYKICGEASNGKDAVSQIIDLEPNLVILDIKMPGLTGIEVMAQIKEHCLKNDKEFPSFIILSGYSDFEYAQKTVNNGAKGYLLKPVDEDLLKEKVLSIAEEIKEKKELNANSTNAISLKTKELIVKLFSSQSVLSEKDVKDVDFFADVHNSCYQVVNLNLSVCPELKLAAVEKSLENYFSFFTNVILTIEKSIFVVIKTKNTTAVHNCIERTAKLCSTKTFICAGDNLAGFEGMLKSYNQSKKLEKYLFYISDKTYLTENLIDEYLKKNAEKKSSASVNEKIERIIFCIETYDKQKLSEIASEVHQCLFDLNRSENEIKNDFIYYIIELRNRLVMKYPEREISDGETGDVVSKILSMTNYESVLLYFRHVLNNLIENFNFNTADSLIVKVIAYVKSNYASDLKLESLGDMFNCNSAYLGKKFKKYTGVQFNTYLDNLRIEEAKNKLINSDLKIYQISKIVGYSNTDYFFMKFKKNTGLTPKEFKMKVENEKN